MTDIREISVDLIDQPEDQQRIGYDEEKLGELAQSIKDHGLLNPISIRPNGARFELIAGSRRLRAHKLLSKATISAIVMKVSLEEGDILRAHENEYREDINPVESAIYIERLRDKHKKTVDEIAKLLNKSVSYVRGRIELLEYPDYILECITKNEMSLGAAYWLNKISDDDLRRRYVRFAVIGGITAHQAHSWFRSWELGVVGQNPNIPPSTETTNPSEAPKLMADCIICRTQDELGNLGLYYAHFDCETKIRPALEHDQS